MFGGVRKRKYDPYNDYDIMPSTQPAPPDVQFLHYYNDKTAFLRYNDQNTVVKEDLARKIQIERTRLIDQTVVPLTHSGSKILHIGVAPFYDYNVYVNISCPKTSFTMMMEEAEYRSFLTVAADSILGNFNFYRDAAYAEEERQYGVDKIAKSCSHDLILMPNDILLIKKRGYEDEKVYLALSTVVRLLNFSGYMNREGFDKFRSKARQRCYPPLDPFIEKIAQELENTDDRSPLELVIFEVIRRDFNDNPIVR